MTKDWKRIRPPVIQMGDIRVDLQESLRYLGVIFNKSRNYSEHLKRVREKTIKIANKYINITRKSYGNSQECLKLIMEKVTKPAVLYAAEIWGQTADKAANINVMAAIQRPFLMAIVKTYKTTSTAALHVLSGMPWWNEAKVAYQEHYRNQNNLVQKK